MSDDTANTEATGDEDIDSSEVTRAPEVKAPKSTLEFVEAKRAERSATEPASKPRAAAESKGSEAPAAEGEEKKADDSKAAIYTSAELREELKTKDLRDLDPKRLPPETKETLSILQAAEGKKHSALNARIKELDDLIAKAKGVADVNSSPQAEEEDENLPVTKEELRAIFKSKAGREFIAETMRELGHDPEDAKMRADQRFMQSAIADASGEIEALQNDKGFFDDTVKAISDNERWAKVVRDSTDKTAVSLTFQAAALKVQADRAAKAVATASDDATKKVKETEARRKEKEAANRKPASKAAGAPKRPTSTSGEKMSSLEFIQNRRAAG